MGRVLVIAVGSSRRPKVEGVNEALGFLAPSLQRETGFEVIGLDVPSPVRQTPLSQAEMMTGARERAEALVRMARERNESWKYFVGLEGGLDVIYERDVRLVLLENWACVISANGAAAFGRSGAIMIPDSLARQVVDERVDLSQAIDAFAGEEGVRDNQGAWGVLTRGLVTRRDAVRDSVIHAFLPLLNDELYAAARPAKR
jgi:inosine/xanthosine triphosphatase